MPAPPFLLRHGEAGGAVRRWLGETPGSRADMETGARLKMQPTQTASRKIDCGSLKQKAAATLAGSRGLFTRALRDALVKQPRRIGAMVLALRDRARASVASRAARARTRRSSSQT